MPSISEIIKDAVVEFSRLQDWMLSAKEHGDMDTYQMMHKDMLNERLYLRHLALISQRLIKSVSN